MKWYSKEKIKKLKNKRSWSGLSKPGWYWWDAHHIWCYGPYKNEIKCRIMEKNYFRVTKWRS